MIKLENVNSNTSSILLMVERTLPYFAAVVFWTVFLLPSASAAPGRGDIAFAAQTSTIAVVRINEKSDVEKAISTGTVEQRMAIVDRVRHRRTRVSTETLKTALDTEKNPLVRRRLVQAVGSLGGSGALGELVRTLSADPDPLIRQAAAQQLVKYNDNPVAMAAIDRCVGKETVKRVRYACVLSLSHSTSDKALDILEKAAKDKDPNMRRQAAYVINGNKSDRAVKILKKLADDKDAAVRETARQTVQ